MCMKYPVQSCVQETVPLVAGTAVSTDDSAEPVLSHRPGAPASGSCSQVHLAASGWATAEAPHTSVPSLEPADRT